MTRLEKAWPLVLAMLCVCLLMAATEADSIVKMPSVLKEWSEVDSEKENSAYVDSGDFYENNFEDTETGETDENNDVEYEVDEEGERQDVADDGIILDEQNFDYYGREGNIVDDRQSSIDNDEGPLEGDLVDEEMEEWDIENEDYTSVQRVRRRWTCYRGLGCYRVFRCHRNWYSARRICRRHGGDLTSIHSYRQNRLIKKFARHYGSLWIGLNDRRRERHFRWSDGTRVNFRRWGRVEPNNKHNEDCVEMHSNGRWNDLKCRRRRRFVCKKKPRRRHHHRHHHRHHGKKPKPHHKSPKKPAHPKSKPKTNHHGPQHPPPNNAGPKKAGPNKAAPKQPGPKKAGPSKAAPNKAAPKQSTPKKVG
ncbi:neurocan core protein-like [Ptychodera flava]|uniref:neurocan core protein-like n=1 Tax=Ptychodera flava TaxID=63121 RepID=UPI00396A87B9